MNSRLTRLIAAAAMAWALAASQALAQSPPGAGDRPVTAASPSAEAAVGVRGVPASAKGSRFRSPEDGKFDISSFLDQVYGFVPVVAPITEPAVGYGLAGALLFVDKPEAEAKAGFGRPNLTAVGYGATQNGTRFGAAGDIRYWMHDRLQTIVAAGDGSVNLDFYGIGAGGVINEHPRSYNLEPLVGYLQAKYRIGDSRLWAGLGYVLADIDVSFEAPGEVPGVPEPSKAVRVGGLIPQVSYDSRDNVFTPRAGTYLEAAPGFFGQSFGGDQDFQRVGLLGLQFVPLGARTTLGLKGAATSSSGDVPFFLRPYVALRGAPVLRYQGEEAASLEAEVRWQRWGRYSLVGFAGAGAAWNDFDHFDDTRTVVTGGLGFRYELARAYGLHAGIDIAFGPDTTAVYVVVGSAWMRP